ncbi:hypothetical protein ONS95_014686 [Cadophora gregata]|uniref:uncharacterized protein n=1 Tax=Cadophora gregata TaxID=51156 RepID=UPI0026DB0127|nr:uncharacterized protein ONS95_014686 [Cadophora gregata]KAK0112972.1 hypothetical protein ONS95_014686 [Cadophora gregata]KAK0125095.1 hypothetical protein ONS96_008961 [Cadophora gregata f. sp. sojae]
MAASYPRRAKPPALSSYQYDGRSLETSSTIRVRKRSRDAIPQGAVASRVKLLQSFNKPRPTRSFTPAPKRTREDSRSGFGRRISRRFGNPAIQSAQPDETPRVESRHSFLGLNPVRTNHEEEHALTDQTVQYSRSPGINGQIGQELDARRQYDAVSPWGVLSRTRSVRGVNHRGYSTDLDALKENNSSGHYRPLRIQSSRMPGTTKKDTASIHSHKIDPRRPKFIDSEASIATTSTIRRQNVRDLFDDYGIQRPAGLTSREVSQDVGELRNGSSTRTFCHVCSWSNSRTSVKCMRCSHQFCIHCTEHPSHLPTTQEEDTLDHVEVFTKHRQGIRNSMPKPTENLIEHDPIKRYQARPDPTPLQSRKGTRKPSSPPIRFPDFYDFTNPQRSPRKMPQLQDSCQEPVPIQELSGRRTTTSVKDSPFLIADLKSPKQSLKLFPSVRRGEAYHTAHNHHKYHGKHDWLAKYVSTVQSESLGCDVSICRATHHGHPSFRHASDCPRKKPKQRVPEDTENGYIADTSRVDDAVYVQSRCNSSLSRPDPRLVQQSGPGYSHLTSSSGPDSCDSPVMKTDYSTHDIPEYVECRGYPRTGHARHGSPVSSGVVGECQHCLDDCQCAACQNTHHSVRCCVHTDHQTIVHHHHTPRKVVTIEWSEEHFPTNVRNVQSQTHVPPVQHHSLELQRDVETHAKEHDTSQKPAYTGEIARPANSTSPMSKAPEEIVTSTKNVKETGSTGVEQNEKKFQDVNRRSKEDTLNFRSTPQEHSSLEASAEPAVGAWLTIPSPHEHDHVHKRRNSCSQSRTSSLDKHSHATEITGAISPPTPPQTTPTEVENITRKLSTRFKQKDHSPVQPKQVFGTREELQKSKQDYTSQLGLSARSGVAELAQRIEQKANKDLDDPYRVTRTPSISSKGSIGSKKKNWRLKLVDWNPEGRKKRGEEHRLSDDEVVSEMEKESYKAMPSVSTATTDWTNLTHGGESEIKDEGKDEENKIKTPKEPGKEHNLSVDEVVLEDFVMEHEHDCVQKKRLEEVGTSRVVKTEIGEEKDLGILGITILVHLAGREDLVARVGNWTGGELKSEA